MTSYDIEPLPGMHPELGLLVASLEDSTREWKDELGDPSVDAIVWQMYPDGPSIGGLLLHLAGAELFWLKRFADREEIDSGHPAEVYSAGLDVEKPYWPAAPRENIEWYLSMLQSVRSESIERVRKHTEPQRVYTSQRGNKFTYRWILAHLIEHDSYTAGQAVLLHETYKKLHA